MHNKKLYICITPFFPSPENWRGAYVLDQVKAIEKNSNYRVIVFKPKGVNSNAEDYEYEGIKVFYFKTISTPSYILHGIFNSINARFFMKRVEELGINISSIAVAHGHTSQFATYSLALKNVNPNIKAVVQHHDCDPYTIRNGRLARQWWNATYRAKKSIELIENIDLNICISESVKHFLLTFPERPSHLYYEDYQQALNSVKGVQPPQIKDTYVLYNGVDTTIFFPSPLTENRNKVPFHIGCIGNFQELKDQKCLLQALKVLVEDGIKDIKVTFVGSGPTLQGCQEFIERNTLSKYVEIRSEVHHSQLQEFYTSLDLFVLPTFFEGFGCVCTEASACGVPYMICKHQGAAEYIAPEELDLWTFEPHDYQTLAKLIKSYKNNPRSQTLIHSYDINELIKDYLEYIK